MIRRLSVILILLLATACAAPLPTSGGEVATQTFGPTEATDPTTVVSATPVGPGHSQVPLLGPAPGPSGASSSGASINAASLTQDWGCGYGFARSDGDETVGLVIHTEDREAARGGTLPALADLADPEGPWISQVTIGAHLFANWCDDVVEEDEPEPVVREEWSVVGGRIATNCLVDDGVSDCVASATITDLVIQRPDGTTETVDRIHVINDCWGCFAG